MTLVLDPSSLCLLTDTRWQLAGTRGQRSPTCPLVYLSTCGHQVMRIASPTAAASPSQTLALYRRRALFTKRVAIHSTNALRLAERTVMLSYRAPGCIFPMESRDRACAEQREGMGVQSSERVVLVTGEALTILPTIFKYTCEHASSRTLPKD